MHGIVQRFPSYALSLPASFADFTLLLVFPFSIYLLLPFNVHLVVIAEILFYFCQLTCQRW
uniref:Uncharacterized protein n=1 Tax=Glycine max TaxID=3847 RepID=C6T6L2_SOYBN|nr:unknown [Glycine max]